MTAIHRLATLSLCTSLLFGCQSGDSAAEKEKEEEQAARLIQEQQKAESYTRTEAPEIVTDLEEADSSTASTTWTTSWNTPSSQQ